MKTYAYKESTITFDCPVCGATNKQETIPECDGYVSNIFICENCESEVEVEIEEI